MSRSGAERQQHCEAGADRRTGRTISPNPSRAERALAPGGSKEHTVGQRVGDLDAAGRARVLGTLQQMYGNAAVQRLVAGASTEVQRDSIFHDTRASLTWKDFKGKVPAGAAFDAGTMADRTSLSWTARATQTGATWQAVAQIAPASLNLRAFMDRSKSWVRKASKSADLLRHEQGHFDIEDVLVEKGELAVRAAAYGVTATASAATASRAVKTAAAQLTSSPPFVKLAAVDAVLTAAQRDYDEDPAVGTDHGTKAAEQATWESDVAAGLPAYPIP